MQLNPESRVYPDAEFLKTGGRWPRGKQGRWPVAAMMFIADLLSAALAIVAAAAAVQFALDGPGSGWPLVAARLAELPVLLALLGVIAVAGGLYSLRGCEVTEIGGIGRAVVVAAAADLAISGQWAEPRMIALAGGTWLLAGVLVAGARMMLRGLPAVRRLMTRHVLLVGAGATSQRLAQNFRENRLGGIAVVGTESLGSFMRRSADDLHRYVALLAANKGLSERQVMLLIAPSSEEWASARDVVGRLEELGLPAELALPYDGLARRGVQISQPFCSDMVLVGVGRPRLMWLQAVAKRLMDVVLSGAALLVLAPLLFLLALLVRMDGGPALFAQARIARGGRPFQVLKFRTMHVDAESKLSQILSADPRAREEWQRHQKLAVDPRITSVGRFLRATSLDELPQLINVLKGDMSLVGPRPIVAGNHRNHAGDAAYARSDDFRYYSQFRPGITGLWQVSGRTSTDYSERVRLDRWYARNWSLWLDVVILFRTVSALINRTGC